MSQRETHCAIWEFVVPHNSARVCGIIHLRLHQLLASLCQRVGMDGMRAVHCLQNSICDQEPYLLKRLCQWIVMHACNVLVILPL